MIGALLRSRAETRSSTTWQLPTRPSSPQPLTGAVSVSRSALLGYVVAQRCVQIISDQIGSLPLSAYVDGGAPVPTPEVLQTPEAGRTRSDFISAATASLLVDGNAYLLIGGRDDLGYATSLLLLDPETVAVRVSSGGLLTYQVRGQLLDSSQLLHVRGFTLPGAVLGRGPLVYNREAIGLAIAQEQSAGERFVSGALPDGVLHADGELTDDQAADLKQAFIAGNGGRQRGPAVLSGGVKYQPLEFSSVDMELLDSRRFSQLQICSMFGVPPHLVGVPSSSKTYSSVTQDSQSFVRFTLRPWLTRLEEALSLLLPPGVHARFDLDSLLRASTADRYQAHATGLAAGFLTVDEVRRLEGLPPSTADPTDASLLAEMVQKIYLGVGTVITAAEARQLLNNAGGSFPIPGPPMSKGRSADRSADAASERSPA